MSRPHLQEISNQPLAANTCIKVCRKQVRSRGRFPRRAKDAFLYADRTFTVLITVAARHLHVSVHVRAAVAASTARLAALVQSNVSMHALPHDPSFIILTLATFLKWRKMLQSALPLVWEKYV